MEWKLEDGRKTYWVPQPLPQPGSQVGGIKDVASQARDEREFFSMQLAGAK